MHFWIGRAYLAFHSPMEPSFDFNMRMWFIQRFHKGVMW
jgi:hypothetical protein